MTRDRNSIINFFFEIKTVLNPLIKLLIENSNITRYPPPLDISVPVHPCSRCIFGIMFNRLYTLSEYTIEVDLKRKNTIHLVKSLTF